MSIAVVDSGGANISSVLHALRRLGAEPSFTRDAGIIRGADRVILPGVGAAGNAMNVLKRSGLTEVLRGLAQPVLGICLGMQLLFESSEEDDARMLGIVPARLTRLSGKGGLRVPHMGWNRIRPEPRPGGEDPLLKGVGGEWFYFVHSFAAPVGHWTLATGCHGETFSAVVRQENFCGAQFHPERSARAGAMLLRNFVEMRIP